MIFPRIREGFVVRETIPDENISGIQGWFFNITARQPSRIPRIREAIGDCFDFAWTNKNLMYGAYQRTTSYFENSDMAAKGPPDAAELALLEPFRDKLPAEVFGHAVHAAGIGRLGPGPRAAAQAPIRCFSRPAASATAAR